MNLTKEMEEFAASGFETAKQFIRDMCLIPAPSGHEEKRAEYVKAWFEANGGENVFIDEALNVVCPYNVTAGNDLIVFMAHTDTVFPDTQPMPFVEKDGFMYSPGVTDDTANLASMITAASYILKNKVPVKMGILFIANSCEEGLGNLKGSRHIFKTYGKRIKKFVTVDGVDLSRIVTGAVGSHRYKVTIRTEGGHSFSKFGNRNAIACLANMITALYSVKVPVVGESRTTYNVGTIEGGTSVNTIAQEASMLYEYRSDTVECLEKMQDMFAKMVEAYRATGIDIECEMIGERPCGRLQPSPEYTQFIEQIKTTIKDVAGLEPRAASGSTDANIPLSLGVPAFCMTGAVGGLCHTREEWLNVDSLKTGIRMCLDFMAYYFA